MQIIDAPGAVLTPIIPAGDGLVIKRCPGAVINLHGQVITGGIDVRDSPGVTVQANGANPAKVVADGSGAPLFIAYNSPGSKAQFIHGFGHPSLVSNVKAYLGFDDATWQATPAGFRDYHGGWTFNRCHAYGVRIGFSIKSASRLLYNKAQGMWVDGVRLLGENTDVIGNQVFDLFDVSDLHPDLIQSYQDVGATVPWNNIRITGNTLKAWYTTEVAAAKRALAQGIFCGRGPYGANILIADNTIDCRAPRAISVPDGIDVRIEGNEILYEDPDPRYPWIINYAAKGTILNNKAAVVKALADADMQIAGNFRRDGVTPSTVGLS